MYLEGFVQEIAYNYSANRLYVKLIEDGAETASAGTCTVTIYEPGSDLDDATALVSSAGMTQLATGSATYYYDLSTTTTATYTYGEDYHARVDYSVTAGARRTHFFFDVVLFPIGGPIVSTDKIDTLHPDWKRDHPSGSSGTWVEAIEQAHMEICRRIRASGDRARRIVKREELWPYELAFAEAYCVDLLMRRSMEERVEWRKRAEGLWSGRGGFDLYNDEGEEQTSKSVGVTKWVR